MNCFKKITKAVFVTVLVLDIAVFSMMIYCDQTIGKSYKIKRGNLLELDSPVPITAEYNGAVLSDATAKAEIGSSFDVVLKMFGVLPFSTAKIEVVDEMQVAVLGQPFGIKLYTNGVLVVELGEVQTANGCCSPAKTAGIKVGDFIETADGIPITCNEDLSRVIADSGGFPVSVEILRNGKKKKCVLCPVFSEESQTYRAGIWVRDSSAGIGTLTFYSPTTQTVCGLGHGICDEDTGTLLTVDSGEMVTAQIHAIEKGSVGTPGELKGGFGNRKIADISANADNGIYGTLTGKLAVSTLTEVALKQEIKNGSAQILCTVDGETPKLYRCSVKKRSANYRSATQNMTVTVTDPELLAKTGGIVQGMSGSPLIQNGKLIGAITHVLVDDPTTGYGIFAENMLETAQSVAKENKLKDAS